MPDFNKPAGQWLGNQLGAVKATARAVASQGTEYIVDNEGVCRAIIGHLIAGPKGEATGLEGWGVAVFNGTSWTKLAGSVAPWIVPALENSWANFASETGDEPVGYLKDALGFVHIRGVIRGGGNGSVAFVLPAGYRPGFTGVYPLSGYGALGAEAAIDYLGQVIIYYVGEAKEQIGLSGITFLAEN